MTISSTSSYLEFEVALARVGGDLDLLREIAILFLENYQEWLGNLRDAVAAGDAEGVERAAHNIKGAVANFGARDAVKAALQLETLGRRGDVSQASKPLSELIAALDALRPDLEAL